MRRKISGFYGTVKDRLMYVLTLCIVLAALALIVGYSFGSFYSIAKEDALQLGEGAVGEEAEKLNNFLLQGLDVVEVTGLNVEYMMQIGRSGEEIERYLLAQSDAYTQKIASDFTGIYGVFNGEYLDGIGWVPDEDFVPQDRPWYTAAVAAGGEPTVVSPYIDAQTGSILISVSQMLSDGESVVSLDIFMDEIQDFPKTINLNGSGYGFVVDSEGLVVAHEDESQKGKNYLTDEEFQGSDQQELTRQLFAAKGNNFQIEIDGEPCSIFSQVVQDDWCVVMVINTKDLFGKVKMNLIRNICLSLVIFAVVAYFCTANYRNRMRVQHYAQELAKYHRTLEDRVQKQTKKIKAQTDQMLQIQEHVIDGMATLIESRDGNTGEHVLSTKKYVSLIVGYMYEHHMHADVVDQKYVEKLISASVLHDVGKIRIPDKILNKPGKFTPEEYEEMKKHSQLGAETVKNIMGDSADEELVQMSCDVARYHHEKWDGTGYPEGLAETQIPLCARIMAVADVFDALVSKRVYKAAMSTEEAFNIIQVEAGSHFDPEIVEIFMELRGQIEEYLNHKRISA